MNEKAAGPLGLTIDIGIYFFRLKPESNAEIDIEQAVFRSGTAFITGSI